MSRMRHPLRAAVPVAALLLCLGAPTPASAQTPLPEPHPTQKEAAVKARASGTFDVRLNPLDAYGSAADPMLGRMSIDKTFHGDLEATSVGEMLTAMTSVKGSAGYVAVERVSGTLQGRTGTFMLKHDGTMARGAQQLVIGVVPDSGTGELAGITGTMTIDIADGKHSYTLEYTLAAQ
jgi:hypothetical protein